MIFLPDNHLDFNTKSVIDLRVGDMCVILNGSTFMIGIITNITYDDLFTTLVILVENIQHKRIIHNEKYVNII